MAIYLKYDGVDGNVTTKGFEKQIELSSATFSAGRELPMSKRAANDRGHAEPHLSEIGAAKHWDDISSSLLFQDSIAGVGDKKAVITFTTTSKNVVVPFLIWELEKVVVSHYGIGGGSDGQPNESFNLNYQKLTVTPYTVKDGTATKGKPVIYSLPAMQANG